MKMINVAVLQGRLVADPELRTTQSGISVTRFRVAVDRNGSTENAVREASPPTSGSSQPRSNSRQADFIDIVAWRGTAEFVCKYFVKGQMIILQGRVQTRGYEDKQGNKRTAVEVVAEHVAFCGQRDRNVESQQRPPQKENGVGHWREGRAKEPPEEDYENMMLSEEDLPF